MKRSVLLTALLLVLIACASLWPKPPVVLPGVITIEAQSLPKIVTLAWDANPAGDNVTNYVVRLDGVVVGSPTGLTQTVTFTTLGTHTISVRAVNLWAESPDATLTVNVKAPNAVTGLRLQ